MDTIFTRGPSLNSRLIMGVLFSILLIVLDHRLDSFRAARVFLNSLVSPLQYAANLPSELLNWTSDSLTTQKKLLEENNRLTRANVLLSERLQQFDFIKLENERLRGLLGTSVREELRKMVAEVMAVDNNPYSHQIVINKGAIDGVYEGQPVIDEFGVVGQILHVATTNSRVLLMTDITHAIPTRVQKNNVQLVVSGSGNLIELTLEHVPHSTDLEAGDILVSSGLGKVFPEGYPVARISSILRDESRPFAQVKATPIAQLDRLKYLLLLWPTFAPVEPTSTTEEEG